jgi:hypothetical protein
VLSASEMVVRGWCCRSCDRSPPIWFMETPEDPLGLREGALLGDRE